MAGRWKLKALFDYLFATSIMIIIFVSATASYLHMMEAPEKEVSQEQLRGVVSLEDERLITQNNTK